MTDRLLGSLPPGTLVASHADAPLGSPLYWVLGRSPSPVLEIEVRSLASGRIYRWPPDRIVTVDPRSLDDDPHYRRLERIRTLVQGTERPRNPEAVEYVWVQIIRILNESDDGN